MTRIGVSMRIDVDLTDDGLVRVTVNLERALGPIEILMRKEDALDLANRMQRRVAEAQQERLD